MKYSDHEAIRKAYPSVVTIDETAGCFNSNGTKVTVTQTKINTARTQLNTEAAAVAYKATRKALYPEIGELADALYWNSKGDSSKLTAYYAACEKVKSDNPKPS